jgi:hypothetical protein
MSKDRLREVLLDRYLAYQSKRKRGTVRRASSAEARLLAELCILTGESSRNAAIRVAKDRLSRPRSRNATGATSGKN